MFSSTFSTMQCNLTSYCTDQSNSKSGKLLCNGNLLLGWICENKPPQHCSCLTKVFPYSAFLKRYSFLVCTPPQLFWHETVKMFLKCSVVSHLAKPVTWPESNSVCILVTESRTSQNKTGTEDGCSKGLPECQQYRTSAAVDVYEILTSDSHWLKKLTQILLECWKIKH